MYLEFTSKYYYFTILGCRRKTRITHCYKLIHKNTWCMGEQYGKTIWLRANSQEWIIFIECTFYCKSDFKINFIKAIGTLRHIQGEVVSKSKENVMIIYTWFTRFHDFDQLMIDQSVFFNHLYNHLIHTLLQNISIWPFSKRMMDSEIIEGWLLLIWIITNNKYIDHKEQCLLIMEKYYLSIIR